MCQLTLNAAMKPGLTKVGLSVALRITSLQILYLIVHGADFAVLLSGLDQICPSPDVSCPLPVRTKRVLAKHQLSHH